MKRNDRLNEVFRKFRQKRALRRFISLFSVFVLLLTINTLKMNADTLERIPSCGIAEHEHGAECFDEAGNLVCGLEAHAHTDACYQERPKGAVAAEAVDTEVCEADDQELDSGLTEDGATPEEGSAEDAGDAIQSGAVDAAVDELEGLTLDDAAEDGDAAEGDDTAEGGDITEGDDTAVDGEIAEDAVEEAPGTPTYSIRNREFVLASELAGAMGLDLARVQDVAAVENEDGTVSGIGVEALDGDWLIYAAREFDEAEVAFILDEGIEVAVLTDGVPLTAPESDRTEGSSDELDLTDPEEDTADDAEDIDDAQADDAQVAAGSEDGTVEEDNDVEIGDDAEDVAGDADEDVPADEDAADENVPADEDAADEIVPADEDAAVTDAGEEAGDEAVAAKAGGEAEGDKIDEADEDGEAEDDKADEEKADEEKADEEKSDEEKVDEEKVDEEKSDEEKVDEEKSDEEKVDEEKSDEEKVDEEKSDEEKADEEKADEEKSDEEKADEEKADEDAKEGEDAEDAADAEDESADGEADGEADGDTDGESGAPGSDEAEGAEGAEDAEGAEGADGQAASPVADDHTLTVDLSEEQSYPLSLRGLMSIFQTAPVAEQPQADADAAAEADAPQAESEAAPAEPAEAEAEAAEPQADTEATEVGTDEDAVVEAVQEETLVGSEDIAEPEAGEAVEVSDIEAVVEEYVQSEAVEAAAAEVEVTMAAPEPVVAAPGPVIDPEAALALSIEYDETLLSVEETGEDWLITPVAAFERTELTVGGVYTIAFINCTVEAPVAMPAQTFEGATDYITVKVEAGEGAFPEGTTMQLADIEDENVLSDIGDAAVTEDFVEVKRVHAVDITFRDAGGNEIEPLIPISVVMSVREIEQDQQTVVVHVDDEGNAAVVEETEVPAADVQPEAPADEAQAEAPAGDAAQDDAPAAAEAEGGEIAPVAAEAVIEEASEERVAFMADAFSIYAMVVTQKIETKVITAEGETYNITVSYGPEAQIPMGATLSVSEIEGDAAQGYLERTEETLDKVQVVTRARFFDIKIMDGETEVQPAVPVTVQAVLANDARDEAENADAVPCAVHFADETVEQPDVVEAAETGETVVFRAACFSVWGVVYTVDFHWTVNGETFDYSIPGGDCASLRDLLGLLNMVADDPETEANELDDFMAAIESVTFSDPGLVLVHKIEEDTTVGALRAALEVESEYSAALTDEQRAQIDARELAAGDWALFSLRPFSTLETLTIAMDNGDTFAIAVTDAQITTRVLTADGQAYIITLTFGPEAEIPLDAELKVEEIEQGTVGYYSYLSAANIAVNGQPDIDVPFARFFDIEIWSGTQKIEPKADVSVSVELAATPTSTDNELKVVHFVGDGPVVMLSETTQNAAGAVSDHTDAITSEEVYIGEGDSGAPAKVEIRFDTNSFSVYGVITYASGHPGVDGLDGRTCTIRRGGQYVTATIVTSQYADNTRLLKSSNSSEAAEWHFEATDQAGYYNIYTNDEDEKKYLQITPDAWYNNSTEYRANTELGNAPMPIRVSQSSDYYSLSVNIEGVGDVYLNEYNNSNCFSGWGGKTSPNDDLTFDFKDPVVQNNEKYMLIVKYEGEHYVILNDGTLKPVTYNEETNAVMVDDPMLWIYDGNHLYHHSVQVGYDSNSLPTDFYYRYIDPTVADGYSEDVPDYTTVVDKHVTARPHMNDTTVAYENNKIRSSVNQSQYIGVERVGTTLKIKGQTEENEAAEVVFANAVNIPENGWMHHAVNHIDISIEGTTSADIPLAYGKYYDEDNNEVLNVVDFKKLHLSEDQVEDKSQLDITVNDVKRASIRATVDRGNGPVELPEAFYIAGYSANDIFHSQDDDPNQQYSDTVQVRIEGVFKVADFEGAHFNTPHGEYSVDPVDENAYNNDWYGYRSYINNYRLNHRVTYSITVVKPITYSLQIPDPNDSTKMIQLYDEEGNKLTVTADVSFSASFDFWDERNECPPIHTDKYGYGKDKWRAGEIWDVVQDIGGIGMDFRLGATTDQSIKVYGVEITKTIVDEDGKIIKSYNVGTNKFYIYKSSSVTADSLKDLNVGTATTNPLNYDDSYSLQHKKEISVGQDGVGLVYDYDVKPGAYYITEDPESIKEQIDDTTGQKWEYKETYLLTEYAWRQDGDDYRIHVSPTYNRETIGAFGSVPEYLGDHPGYNGIGNYSNDFLEFYVYNVYKHKIYPVYIRKVDSVDTDKMLTGAKFDLYGPYDAERSTDDADTTTGRMVTKINERDIVVGEDGIASLGDLVSGTYYLYETEAPAGYIKLSQPVKIVVNSRQETPTGGAVTYNQNDSSMSTSGNGVEYNADTHTYSLKITNDAGARLPSTGGVGTTAFYLPGGLITLLALVLLITKRRAD